MKKAKTPYGKKNSKGYSRNLNPIKEKGLGEKPPFSS